MQTPNQSPRLKIAAAFVLFCAGGTALLIYIMTIWPRFQ